MSELFTLDALQEFWAKRPKGAGAEFYVCGGHWNLAAGGPQVGGVINSWRWEPQSKPIDLSPLVGSDVLCEFGHGVKRFGFLKEVSAHGEFIDEAYNLWAQCRPVMNKWMAVDKDMFIPEGLDSTVVYVGGWVSEIKLVKFTGRKEGYLWPWEDK